VTVSRNCLSVINIVLSVLFPRKKFNDMKSSVQCARTRKIFSKYFAGEDCRDLETLLTFSDDSLNDVYH